MSYVIRQEMFGNLNPLMKKYKYDGEVPAAYINAEKRHKISQFMGKSSYLPGTYGKFSNQLT